MPIEVERLARDMPELPDEVVTWVQRLVPRLETQRDDAERLWRWYDGKHPLPEAPRRILAKFERLATMARLNMCELVVNAPAERLKVNGIDVGGVEELSTQAWEWWKRNRLSRDSRALYDEALVAGRAFVMVWPDGPQAPRMTVEHSREMTAAYAPGSDRLTAALKVFADEWDTDRHFVTLYLPGAVWKFTAAGSRDGWSRREDSEDPAWPLPNPLGEVPVVPFANRWRVSDRDGSSELSATVLAIQSRMNKTVFDRLTAAEMTAIRQRWATGLEMPTDPDTGQPVHVDTLKAFDWAVDRFWHTPGKDAKFGEFGQTDLAPFINSVEADVQHLAAITRTPPHYLLGQSGAFPSGESLNATETGLVAKVEKIQDPFGESWEEVYRLAFKAARLDVQTQALTVINWRDPQKRTEGEHIDALLKKQAIGVPREQLFREMGYNDAQIARFQSERATDALLASAFGAPVPTEPGEPAQPMTGAFADGR